MLSDGWPVYIFIALCCALYPVSVATAGLAPPDGVTCVHVSQCRGIETSVANACTGQTMLYQSEAINNISCGRLLWSAVCCNFENATGCEQNQYLRDSDIPTSLAECHEISLCGPGQLQTSVPTLFSDRRCSECPSGTFQQLDHHALDECLAHTPCYRGSFVATFGNSTHDTICELCPDGTYNEHLEHFNSSCDPQPICGCGSRFIQHVDGHIEGSGSCHTCPNRTFQNISDHRETECIPISGCSHGAFMDNTGVGLQCNDAQCKPCPIGYYQPNNVNFDSSCPMEWSDGCELGTYVSSIASTSSDWICSACPPGSYQNQTGFTGTSCTQFAPCEIGWGYTHQNHTATSARVCASCVSNLTYNNGSFGQCEPIDNCSVGTFVSLIATTTSNRECSDCANGTFSLATNTERCISHSGICSDASFEVSQPTSSSDRLCAPLRICEPGTYAPSINSSQCVSCLPDTFSTHVGDNFSCQQQISCPAGTYIYSSGTLSSQRECAPCNSGEFTSTPNMQNCTRWTLSCVPGSYEARAPSMTSDRICESVQTCVAGTHISTAATATSDRHCETCPEGSFSLNNNSIACNDQVSCFPGEFYRVLPSVRTRAVCRRCSTGYYSLSNNSHECIAAQVCRPGEYVSHLTNGTTDSECMPCSNDSFSLVPNAPRCFPVSDPCAQEFEEVQASTPTSDRVCARCPGTTLAVMNGGVWTCVALEAVQCLPGTFISFQNVSTRLCSSCPEATFSTSINSHTCQAWTRCLPGTYIAENGTDTKDSRCENCVGGISYTNLGNQHTCSVVDECGPGTKEIAQPTSSQNRICVRCSLDEFREDDNATVAQCQAKTRCDESEYISNSGTSSTDRICDQLTNCTKSEVEVVEPTASSNRQCMNNTCITGSSCLPDEACVISKIRLSSGYRLQETCTPTSTVPGEQEASDSTSSDIDTAIVIGIVALVISGVAILFYFCRDSEKISKKAPVIVHNIAAMEQNPTFRLNTSYSVGNLCIDANGKTPVWYIGHAQRDYCNQVVLSGPLQSFVVRVTDDGSKFELIVNQGGKTAHFLVHVDAHGQCWFGPLRTVNIEHMIQHLQNERFIGTPLDAKTAFEQTSSII